MFEKINTDGFKLLLTTRVFKLPSMVSIMTVGIVLGILAEAALAQTNFGPSPFQKKNDAIEKPSFWQQFKQKAVELKVTAEKTSKSGVAFIKQHSKEVSIATVAIIGAALLLRCKAGNTTPPLSELQKKSELWTSTCQCTKQSQCQTAPQTLYDLDR
jgi:hypothetical protein